MKKLIVVESPTKAKTLARFLPEAEYQIESTMGHVRDLPEKKLGVEVDKDFTPLYVISPSKKELVAHLQTVAQKASQVYLASDPDREGEAIAWHVQTILTDRVKTQEVAVWRISFHEITEKAIRQAIDKPGKINLDLVEAQAARRILDRLVGYRLSPLLWKKIRRGLSAGRVQSVAVRLIVEREREIEKFVPVEYWEIFTRLQGDGPPAFEAKLVEKNGQKLVVGNESESAQIVAELEKADYEVVGIEQKETKRNPAPPFTTSTLQQTAANRFGWSAKKTMSIAQGLYEKGLVTYHRTDSTHLAFEAVTQARELVKELYGPAYLPAKPRFYQTKSRSAQEAHEAIRPTAIKPLAVTEEIGSMDEKKLYGLIWKRFVACQINGAVMEITTLVIQGAGEQNLYGLEIRGGVEKFAGWRCVYRQDQKKAAEGSPPDEEEDGSLLTCLPSLRPGDDLDLLEIRPEQKFTQPPPRYSEASLIKELEELGVGRPSTYAPIISTIQDRNYVEKQERALKPTPLGLTVNDFLLEYFPDVLDYQFTAKMEADLDAIASGEKQRVPVLREFYQPFIQQLEGVEKVAQRVAVETEATGEDCPRCREGAVVIRVGRFGKFLSCSRFPECDWKASLVKKVENFNCPKCGGEVVYKKTRKGRFFYGCANYPKCDWASWRKPN